MSSCIFDILLVRPFLSALLGVPVDETHDFEGVTAVIQSGFILSFQSDLFAFVSDVALFFVRQASPFGYVQTYLAYSRALEVNFDDGAFVGWFMYAHLCAKILDIPAREVTSAKKYADDVQVKRFVRSVSVEVSPGPRRTFEEAHIALSAVYDFSSGFLGL